MSEYEFKEEENKTINGVKLRLVTHAILLSLGGIFSLITAIATYNDHPAVSAVSLIIQSCLMIATGPVFFRPVDNLKRITKTEGSDIKELMRAMEELSQGFLILFMLILGLIAFDVIIIVGSI